MNERHFFYDFPGNLFDFSIFIGNVNSVFRKRTLQRGCKRLIETFPNLYNFLRFNY